jgi:hypothetical protein
VGVFPAEGPGRNYALNWALNHDGVTPGGEAFHNVVPAAGGKGGGKAAVVDLSDDFVAGVVCSLEASPSIWVHDGAVATGRGTDMHVRIITDNADVASGAKSIVVS